MPEEVGPLPLPVPVRYPQENQFVASARSLIAERSISSATSERDQMIPLYVAELMMVEQIDEARAKAAVNAAIEGLDAESKGRDRTEDKRLLRERLQVYANDIRQEIRKPTVITRRKWEEPSEEERAEGKRGRWLNQYQTVTEGPASAALWARLLDVEKIILVLEKMPSIADGNKIYELILEQAGKLDPEISKAIRKGKSVASAIEDKVSKKFIENG